MTDRRWNVWLAIPITIAAIVGSFVALVVAQIVHGAAVDDPVHRAGVAGLAAHGDPPLLTTLGTFGQDLGAVAGVLVVVALATGGRFAPALGLRAPRMAWWKAAGLVVAGYVLFLIVSAAWTNGLGITDHENVPVKLGTRDSAGALIGAAFLVATVAPIAEELLFRGFIFGGLRRHGLALSAGVTGVLFGLVHVMSSPIGFIVPLGVLGVILCLLYERTGSLYVPIGLHCLNNSIAFGAGDGRGWLVPVVFAGSAVLIALALRGIVALGNGRLGALLPARPGPGVP